MTAVIVNAVAVIIGGTLGMLLNKGIPERISNAVMAAIGLCSVYIGVSGALAGDNTIVLILSMTVGTAVGTLLNIDGLLSRAGNFIESRFQKKSKSGVSLASGFVTGSLLFCVGAMTIVGSINSGLKNDSSLIYTKAVLDLISSCMLASALGGGVILASVVVLVYQGGLVLLAQLLSGVLTDTAIVNEICCCGSVIIIGLGLNILKITKLKVADMLPAVFLVPLFYYLVSLIPIL